MPCDPLLDLIRGVAQATVELIAEETGPPHLWAQRHAIADRITEATVEEAGEDPAARLARVRTVLACVPHIARAHRIEVEHG